MNNSRGSGATLTAPAPSGGVVSGVAYQIGDLVVIATETVAQTVLTTFAVTGEFRVPKPGSQAWTVGAKIYFDAPNSFTTTSSGNTLCGVAAEAVGAGAGETTGIVRLDGVAR